MAPLAPRVDPELVSQEYLEAARSLKLPGFRKIRRLNPHLLKWLRNAKISVEEAERLKQLPGNRDIAAEIMYAMEIPTQIFLAYFSYWPHKDGKMIEKHMEIVGVAVFMEAQQAHWGKQVPYNLDLVRRGETENNLWGWKDLIDFIVKLIVSAKVRKAPKAKVKKDRKDTVLWDPSTRWQPENLLHRLCCILRYHWPLGTSQQEADFQIGYTFLTSSWANAFVSTRARVTKFILEEQNRDTLHKEVMGPVGPVMLEVWTWDVNKKKEREELDTATERLTTTWCGSIRRDLRITKDDLDPRATLIRPMFPIRPAYVVGPRTFFELQENAVEDALQKDGTIYGPPLCNPNQPPRQPKAQWVPLPRRQWKYQSCGVEYARSASSEATAASDEPADVSIMAPIPYVEEAPVVTSSSAVVEMDVDFGDAHGHTGASGSTLDFTSEAKSPQPDLAGMSSDSGVGNVVAPKSVMIRTAEKKNKHKKKTRVHQSPVPMAVQPGAREATVGADTSLMDVSPMSNATRPYGVAFRSSTGSEGTSTLPHRPAKKIKTKKQSQVGHETDADSSLFVDASLEDVTPQHRVVASSSYLRGGEVSAQETAKKTKVDTLNQQASVQEDSVAMEIEDETTGETENSMMMRLRTAMYDVETTNGSAPSHINALRKLRATAQQLETLVATRTPPKKKGKKVGHKTGRMSMD